MDHIRQAIERAKGPHTARTQTQDQPGASPQQPQFRPDAANSGSAQMRNLEVTLSGARLESKRIITHDNADPRSRSFDMLRTQVLQAMDMKTWQLLGVTSPTAACGKTMIAVNLALSIARQSDRPVLLVDLDLQKPQVANTLGLNCDHGLISILEGRTNLSDALVQTRIRNEQLLVLPCEIATLDSSELMASRQMSALLQEIKRDFRGWTVIFDLPPTLTGDEVISILPQIDCVLFVTAAGTSTVSEIKECNRHLESTPVVRVVVNKAADTPANYYSYAQYANKPAARGKSSKKSNGKRSRSSGRLGSSLNWVSRLADRIARF